ncbi:MAG: hypothetical protein V3W04_00075 [Gammaproteobacteria bacterium]
MVFNYHYTLLIIFLLIPLTGLTAVADYLNDNDIQAPVSDPLLPNLSDNRYPRIIMSETQAMTNDVERYAKYHIIATTGGLLRKVSRLQALYPDVIYFRQLMAAEYLGYTDEKDNITCAQSHGIPFENTASATQNCKVYAGHWLYQAGSKLTRKLNTTSRTVYVGNAKRFKKNNYVVIYNAPAGSFKNAEHAKITSINITNNTLQLQRGYKSRKRSHNSGSVIAHHAVGQGGDPKNWAYNMSTQCPTDGNAKTYNQVMLDFIVSNKNRDRKGIAHNLNIRGFLFDSDFHFVATNKKIDANNDLVQDNGISNDGTNWWGSGMNAFYSSLKTTFPDMYLSGGHHKARAFQAVNGAQLEGWPVDSDFHSANPTYQYINSRLSTHSFYNHFISKGPAISHALSKTPSMTYPKDTNANSNAPIRFALGSSLLEDGYYGAQNSPAHPDTWYDEYAVDVKPGSINYGEAIPADADVDLIRSHRGWLGMPLSSKQRIAQQGFAPQDSLIPPGTFENGISGWSGQKLTVSQTTDAIDGTGALRASIPTSYSKNIASALIQGPSANLIKNNWYTLVFSAKSSKKRAVKVNVGGHEEFFYTTTSWRRFVISFEAIDTSEAISILLGREISTVSVDSVYLFEGNANVFRRTFENGMVIVNATPETRTIDLGGTYQHINGTLTAH